ncbi:uncharacterized protein AB675_2373 [Cyphellophora attinorum]|uniref:Uncharacterized protein n=1 Tax=Cyphellophora attinorum TaxID=1664694 RepID=A0A0N1HGM6_9EURO|nr:uncharacterized protein AB675_2373 [Phialophora attinorum]KPI44804.1 hypothetical protein AB675_2373 [Phialophora attinorum]
MERHKKRNVCHPGRVGSWAAAGSYTLVARSRVVEAVGPVDEEIISAHALSTGQNLYSAASGPAMHSKATSALRRSLSTLPSYRNQAWTVSPLYTNYLEGCTFDDYLNRCRGLNHAANFCWSLQQNRHHISANCREYYTNFRDEIYGVSLYICHKLLAHLNIESPGTAVLCKVPARVIRDLNNIAEALFLLAELAGDKGSNVLHRAFHAATEEAWEMQDPLSWMKRGPGDGYCAVSMYMPDIADMVMKQLIASRDGHIVGPVAGGAPRLTNDWAVHKELGVVYKYGLAWNGWD